MGNTEHPSIYDAYEGTDDAQWSKQLFGLCGPGAAPVPKLAPEHLQHRWVGASGAALAAQSLAFYQLLKNIFSEHGCKPLKEANVLDFGCGWGRMTRYFAKDMPDSQIFGCDPLPQILKWCDSVPGTFRVSDHQPARLPFDEKFDLIWAFSVFTHLSERTHMACLKAIQQALAPGGIAALTVRPREFITHAYKSPAHDIREYMRIFDDDGFVFVPNTNSPIVDGETTYGGAIFSPRYIERNWTGLFRLIGHAAARERFQIPVIISRPD